jgi:uncharacterized membrane protein (DUF373 family)
MKEFLNSPKILIIILTIILFGVSYFTGMANVIIYTLNFLILVEIVRTIVDYINNPEHRIKIRYIIDSGILFSIRELFVGMVMMKTPALALSLIIIITSMLVLGGLIFYRHKVIKSSPDQLEQSG